MKHNWKHIKFGDAFNLQMGKTPARANSAYWSNGLYDWVSISDMPNGKYIQGTKEKISQKAVDETGIHLVKKGTALMSFKLTIGKTAIAPYDLYTNEAIMAFEPKDGTDVLADFLYYYLQLYEWDGNRAVMGNTTNKGVISNSYAYIPSLDEQQAIVRELDGINRLIDLQEEQLREYDRLAQSLFYTTFGDPVSNPKGWEVKKLGDIATVKIGPFGSLLHTSDYIKGGVPLVNPIHMKNGYIVADDNFTISEPKAEELRSYRMSSGDFIFARRGDIGRCAIVTEKEDGFLCGTGSLFVRFDGSVVPIYALFWTKSESFVKELTSKAKGATMLNINCGIVENLLLPLPPLSLQQTFAAKIETIEQQKALIRRSLDETRTLLAARMQYYFNS